MVTTSQSTFATQEYLLELAEVLDRDWDPEFDTVYDDLEREFAELRLQSNVE